MEGQHLRVFVACGTGAPFRRLLAAVESLVSTSTYELFVQRGAGTSDFAHLPGTEIISREEFAARLSWANAVVCHAGAGALYEAHAAGHYPIALARLKTLGEHVNDHQLELLMELVGRGIASELDVAGAIDTQIADAAARRKGRTANPSVALVQAVRCSLQTEAAAPPRPRGTVC